MDGYCLYQSRNIVTITIKKITFKQMCTRDKWVPSLLGNFNCCYDIVIAIIGLTGMKACTAVRTICILYTSVLACKPRPPHCHSYQAYSAQRQDRHECVHVPHWRVGLFVFVLTNNTKTVDWVQSARHWPLGIYIPSTNIH